PPLAAHSSRMPRGLLRERSRMRPVRTALFAAAFTLAAPLAAENHVQPAVQPGGDIPAHFRPVAPIPKGGDIPQTFTAPRGEFQYVRREVNIPMRDGVK